MGSWDSAPAAILAVWALLSSIHALDIDHTTENGGLGRRVLLSFKETPHGTNLTFDCSPSGPCVPCAYSEKGIILCLLLASGSVVYFRRKQTATVVAGAGAGAGRIQMNRFEL
uniref:Xylanase inhibitor N-terminal domain-containing protein n=1 Tax=Populus trichocarpa TaxID=3694 RepID=A9PH89_POPTR|nr:unknown [Populus trichocarpa]